MMGSNIMIRLNRVPNYTIQDFHPIPPHAIIKSTARRFQMSEMNSVVAYNGIFDRPCLLIESNRIQVFGVIMI